MTGGLIGGQYRAYQRRLPEEAARALARQRLARDANRPSGAPRLEPIKHAAGRQGQAPSHLAAAPPAGRPQQGPGPLRSDGRPAGTGAAFRPVMQPYAQRGAGPAAPLIERDGNWYRLDGEGTAIEDTVPEPGDFIRGGRVWRMPKAPAPAPAAPFPGLLGPLHPREDGEALFDGGAAGASDLPRASPRGSTSDVKGSGLAGQLGGYGQGLGDAVSFGLYSGLWGALPGNLGEMYRHQTELPGYDAGFWTGAGASGARLLYAGAARGLSALPGRQAVRWRNNLKGAMSGLFGAHPRRYTYEQLLRKYGSDERVRQAAGRTNPGLNAAAGVGGASSFTQIGEAQWADSD